MKTRRTTYRVAVGLALATPLFLVWLILAVGVIAYSGYRGDVMYLGVLGVELVGATISRLRPHGMARAMFATALAQALVAVIALIAGMHEARGSSVPEILGVNGMFVVLFGVSAWLFRRAGRERAALA